MRYRIAHIQPCQVAPLAAVIAAGVLLLLVAPAGAQTPTEAGMLATVQSETEGIAESATPVVETSTEPEPLPADVEAASMASTVSGTVDIAEGTAREPADEAAGSVVDVVDAVAPTAVGETHGPVAQIHETVRDLTAPAERSLQQAGAKLGDLSPKPAPRPAVPLAGSAPAAKGVAERPVAPTATEDLPPLPASSPDHTPRSSEEIELEPLPAWATAGRTALSVDPAPSAASTPAPSLPTGPLAAGDVLSSGPPSGGSEEHAPVSDASSPPAPEMLSAAASGSGGSTLVPIAALLALLALVAPAISRRLREMADLSPPLPFACALERPG